jgi:hypothetical protein
MMPARLPVVPSAAASRLSRLAAALAATVVLAAGCGDDPASPPPPGDGGVVVITPGSASVIVRATKSFTATVDGQAGAAVTWRLERATPTPTGVDLGALEPSGPAGVVYTAPERVESVFDYRIRLIAASVADTTARDTALITVPRIQVALTPGSLGSVLPGTLVPYAVRVENTTEPGLTLYVQGVPGGDDQVGTFTQTGPTTAVYQAPLGMDQTTTLDLLARSVDDTTRFGSAIVTVRRGYPLPVVDPARGEYAPAWSPAEQKLAYVRGGPPWELVIYDFTSFNEQTVAAFDWAGADYDGKLSWSRSGALIAFSQTQGGQRVIGVVGKQGGTPAVLAPDAATQYYEASFVPARSAGPESLVVAQQKGAVSALRVYPLGAAAGDPGRLLHTAAAGQTVRWPDAITRESVPGFKALYVTAAEGDGGWSDVLLLADDGGGAPAATITGGPGNRTYLRWAWQLAGPLWIVYIWDGNHTSYRVAPQPGESPIRLYSEFFPELGGDLSVTESVFQRFDAHVLSRRHPDGMARLWVVEFPPQEFLGVPRPEELELASMGIRGALAPAGWGRWLRGYEPAVGLRPGEVPRHGFAGTFAPRRRAR